MGLYHFTTVTNQVKETNSTVDIGYHYVALDTNNVPVDTDTGGVADYLEDANGNGTVNTSSGETDWTSGHGGDDKDHKVNKHLLTPGYLRCEYRVDPWGVDAKDPWTGQQKPRLYWIVTSQRRAAKQVAYRILVASSPENLNANNVRYVGQWPGLLRPNHPCGVQSDATPAAIRSAPVVEGERPGNLFSGKASPWSTNGFFQMGSLNPTNDWGNAKWIGVNNYSGSSPCPMFRKEFSLTSQIKSATAYVSAKGVYDLWINGRKIGPNVLAPEWTDYDQRIQYQTFDVTTNLLTGTPTWPSNNVLGAVAGEGWFSSNYPGHGAYGNGTGNPQVLLRLVITKADLSTTTVVSDGNWASYTDGSIQSAGILAGEKINANKEGFTPAWSTPSYTQANLFSSNSTVQYALDISLLFSQPNDPIQIMQFITPVNVWTTSISAESVTKVFDMGQNMVGWCKLSVDNTNGGSAMNWDVKLKHAEALELGPNKDDPNGPSTRNVFVDNLVGALQEDRFILNGEATQEFQPHFTYHGFRFVRVTAPPTIATRLTTNSLVGCVIHSSVPVTGAFACYGTNAMDNNAKAVLERNLVNKLMTNAFWSLRGNLQGVFTACTQRYERQGYFYDEHIFSQTACYFADMSGFLSKFIKDVRENQAANGRYSVYAPYANFSYIDPPAGEDPGLEVGGLIFPWRMYQNYADTRILREHYNSATNWLNYATNHFRNYYWANFSNPTLENPPHSQFNVGDWMHSYHVIDDASPYGHASHPTGYAPTSANYSGLEGTNWGTAWYAFSADTVSAMSQVLQEEAVSKGLPSSATFFYGHSTNYAGLAAKVRTAYTNSTPLPWIKYDQNNKITNVFYNTQADCVMALHFDMVPQTQRSNVLDILLNAPYGINNFNTKFGVYPRLSTGYFCSSRGMLELTRNGHTRLAYKLLLDARFPSWVYPADNGFTTCWEGWNTYVSGIGYYPEADFGSFNHLTFGAVGEWIWQVVGGINPDQDNPGFANVIIKPEPGGGITNSFASFNSIRGEIRAIWTNDVAANAYVLNLTVPANATATVFMPTTNNPTGFTESGLGTVFSAVSTPGLLTNYTTAIPGWTNGASVFRVGSGAYRFAITNVVLQ
ncbi:MAG: family 78 glycoside hydrolase catalytic domain [Verrucomicrobiota bacterium]